MKRMICLFLALLMLAGCAADPSSPKQATKSTEAAPQEETDPKPSRQTNRSSGSFGLAYVPEYGLNPYSCNCITNRPILSLTYESLFVLNHSYEPEPVLCDQFAVSADGKHYLLTILPDAEFSDGTPVTAADAVASLEAARDSEYYGSRFSKVDRFRAVDDRKLAIDLYYSYENLPLLLDVPIVKAGTQKEDYPIGSGPYYLSTGAKLTLRRNHDWWQNRNAPIEYQTITLTATKDPTETRDSFEFGTTSLVCADLNAPNAVGYRCDYELWDCPTTSMMYLGFNTAAGMFVNREFRAGITHVIDRSAITTTIYKGFAEAACLPCSPDSPLYDAELAKSYAYDPSAFAQARTHANLSPDYVGTLLVCSADSTRVETAHRIADMMDDAGLRVEVAPVDYDTFHYRLLTGDFDCYLGETRLSANFDLTEFFKRYGKLSFGSIESNAMEKLCYDALENSGNCYDLFRNVMEQGFFCPLLFKSYAVMGGRGAITSLQPALDNVFHLSDGRSLADAGTVYEILTGEISEVEPEETSQPTEPLLP